MKRTSEAERFEARCHAIDLADLSILCWEAAGQIPQGTERDRILQLAHACSFISGKMISRIDQESRKAYRSLRGKHD